VSLIPIDSPASAELGLVGHRPYLYYFSLGRLLQLAPAGIDELRFLRLANCLLGLCTALVAYRWIRLVSSSPLVRLAFLVFVTNTLMWSALFASVSYDNLANLLAALACYQLTRFCSERDPGSLAAFGLWTGLGILTKRTLVPLAAILLLVLLVRERRVLPSLLRSS
jgi:4-amino-4-deoxy-L-arabinose transferase-like glycosyltransferase